MPSPLVVAGIAAGAQLAGSGINAASQGNQNRKNRKFAEHMYEKQRTDALTDQQFQNEYNSPAAQMARLKAAGLNPNLVYGDGATTTAAPIRSSSFSSPDTRAPEIDLGGAAQAGLMAYNDTRMKDAQINLVKEQTKVAREEAINKAIEAAAIAATTGRTLVGTDKDRFELETAKLLQSSSLQAAQLKNQQTTAEIAKINADTKYTLNQDERTRLASAQSLQKGVQEILNLRAQRAKTGEETREIRQKIYNMQQEYAIKQLDERLSQLGVRPTDPFYARVAAQLAGSDNIQEAVNKMLKFLKNPVTGWRNMIFSEGY